MSQVKITQHGFPIHEIFQEHYHCEWRQCPVQANKHWLQLRKIFKLLSANGTECPRITYWTFLYDEISHTESTKLLEVHYIKKYSHLKILYPALIAKYIKFNARKGLHSSVTLHSVG